MRALARRSVEVIRDGQAPSGAYVACPTFPPYGFSWFRDGAFIADAMSRVGETRSAEAFFGWCSRVIAARRNRPALAARYTLDGEDDTSDWPLLQHDGYGLWLWALRGHLDRHGDDVYYGGGEWILLTALLGWSHVYLGAFLEARRPLDWILDHATPDGELPEQSQDHLLHPETWDDWVAKWGPPPSPLLWSHAMFLTLAHELGQV